MALNKTFSFVKKNENGKGEWEGERHGENTRNGMVSQTSKPIPLIIPPNPSQTNL